MSYKKTALIPGKCPDIIIQYQTVHRIQSLSILAEAGVFHLVFANPIHKVHNTVPGYCWQKKGKKGTLMIPSNSGRKRVTILGFIDAVKLKFTSLVTESNCNTSANELAQKELRNAYPDGKEILVIQDNAKYNHSFASGVTIKKLNIIPVFLPPYSPNLNLIERIWKFMKKKIMKNTYYPTFKLFWNAIINFCGDFDNYRDEVKTIMNQKFQILTAA